MNEETPSATIGAFLELREVALARGGRFEDAVVHGDRAAALLESVTGLPDLPVWSLWDGLARVRASESASGKRKSGAASPPSACIS